MPKVFNRQAAFTAAAAGLLILLALAFLVVQLRLPYDDARLEPGSRAIEPAGVRVAPIGYIPDGLRSGDVVTAIAGRSLEAWAGGALGFEPTPPDWQAGDVVAYGVLRNGERIDLSVKLAAYPLATIARQNWGTIAFALVFLPVATFVFLRRPELPAARALFLAGAALFSATTWSLGIQANSFVYAAPLWLFYLTIVGGFMMYWIAALHFALVFPRPLPLLARQRWLLPALYLFPYVFVASLIGYTRQQSANVLEWISTWATGGDMHAAFYLALALLVMVVQYRRSQDEGSRRKMRWLAFAALVVGGSALFFYLLPPLLGGQKVDSNLIGLIGLLFPVAVAIAILRHNLFDIDSLLNRALLYTLLTGSVLMIYGLSVGALSLSVQSSSRWLAALLTGGFLALVFRPLQSQMQRAADYLVPQSSVAPANSGAGPSTPGADPGSPAEQAAKSPRPSSDPRHPLLRFMRLAWYPFAAASIVVVILGLPAYLALLPEGPHTDKFIVNLTPLHLSLVVLFVIVSLAAPALSFALAWVLQRRKGHETMALFLAYFFLLHGVLTAGPLEALEYLIPGIADFAVNVLQPTITLPLSFLVVALFPDGRFVPRWSRWPVAGAFVLGPISSVYLMPGRLQTGSMLHYAMVALTLSVALLLIYAQVIRYRNVSSTEERQQTKWFLFGFVVWIGLMMISSVGWFSLEAAPSGSLLPWWAPFTSLLWALSTAVLPIALTVAVMRFRLYDIDLILNRTFVYAGLSAVIVLLYVVIVGGLSGLFQTSGSFLISLIGTGLVAILLNPVRVRLQGAVDRLLYGQRDDPATVLERLQAGFESVSDPDTLLGTIASIITDTLKLPYVAFELSVAGRQIATHAGRPTNPAVKIPLLYREEQIGHMLVAPRAADELLSAADEKLLRQIAVQTTAAIRAMYLAEDLQRVRAGLVATREEERRRLRRDLHDSVGPVLASQGLKMAAVQELVEQDPEMARHLIEDLIEQNEHTVAEIRRLVYGLRPPALDELGLVGAISDFAADLNHGNISQGRLAVRVHSPQEGLPPLPAAVEVAAYRIATEAITNVARHASAQRCDIRLSMQQEMPGTPLLVEVTDNGRGLPPAPRSGVGTNSMRERAQEIGGVLEIESKPGQGTQVRARLPLGGIAV